MSKDWQVFVETSNYGWSYDGLINRPNEDLEYQFLSTQQTVKLADGSNAFVRPETKRIKEAFTMTFINTTSAFRTQIEIYMLNADKIKIITHTGEEFRGRIIDMRRVWFAGIEPDTYDIQISFMPES